jgi:hypothetical protein
MMDDIRDQLIRRDYLYGDAAAYRAGVDAALAALAATLRTDDDDQVEGQTATLLTLTR